jgi:hypothetical protein
MDPITIIVTALATGAASGLKPAAERVIKEAYDGIKTLIQRKYGGVDVAALEKKPDSKAKQDSVAEDLTNAGAAEDGELLDRAKALIDAIETHDQATAAALGVDLAAVKAAYLNVRKVVAEGTGVKVRQGEFTGGIDIGEVQAGKVGGPRNP